jgi:hypothetical protein
LKFNISWGSAALRVGYNLGIREKDIMITCFNVFGNQNIENVKRYLAKKISDDLKYQGRLFAVGW